MSHNKKREYYRKNVTGQEETKAYSQRKPEGQVGGRDRSQNKNFGRPQSRYNNQDRHASSRYGRKVRSEETVDDIRIDIERIEKEIRLEIDEIKSLKL